MVKVTVEIKQVDHPALTSDVKHLLLLNDQAKWIKTNQDLVKERITNLMESEFPEVKVEAPSGMVQLVDGSNFRIDPGVLLERGVDPAIIEAARKTTYFTYPKVEALK